MKLSLTQTQALDFLEDDHTTEVLFGGGAGGGKTALLCYFAMKMALKYPGSRGLIGRAIFKTLMDTTIKTFWEVAAMQGVSRAFRLYDKKVILGPNKSEIMLRDLFAYPSDPEFDELGSLELTWAAVDEANQLTVKAKNILKSRIRYRLDEYGIVPKMLYTCNPAKNWVKTEFRDPFIKGTLSRKKKFVQSLLKDNDHVFKGYEEALMELDTASRERLLFGNWDYSNDPSALIKAEAINAIFTNDQVKPTGKKYITVDVARLGSDKTVIRVWDGWRVIKRVVYEHQRTTETAAAVRKLSFEYEIPMFRVLCDEDGVGGGVVDQLRCKGFIANSSPFKIKNNENFASLKDQCGWYLANMINNGGVYERADGTVREMIQEELEQIKHKDMDKDGKRRLMAKDQIKLVIGRSPDDSDTYLMRAWFDLSALSAPTTKIISGKPEIVTNGRTDYNM